MGSFAKLLRDLEKPSVHSSRVFFDGCGMTLLHEAVLQEKAVCMSSLPEPTGDSIVRNHCPQLSTYNSIIVPKTTNTDICFCFLSLLVVKRIFKEMFVFFYGGAHAQ